MIVNRSSRPSRGEPAALDHSRSSQAAYYSSFAFPSFTSRLNAALNGDLIGSCQVSGRWPRTLRSLWPHRRAHAENQVDRLPRSLRPIDHEQALTRRGEAALDQVFPQRLGRLGVLRRPFTKAENMLIPLVVDAHGANNVV